MAKFQIRRELDALCRADVAIRHKDHVCDRAARKYDTADELADQIQTAMLIRDSHDDANRDEEHASDAKSKQESIPGKMHRIVLDYKHPDGEHGDKGDKVPMHWSILVPSHKTSVNIIAATHHVFGVSPASRSFCSTLLR